MIQKDNLSMLHTRPEDEEFHRSRRMFVIKDGRVKVGLENVKDSHMEWFKKEGWITEKNAEEFMKTNVRGFYLQKPNALYCYRGTGFAFDDKVLPEILNQIEELKQGLDINDETEIHLGPRDNPIYDIDWQRVYVGKIKELTNGDKLKDNLRRR